MSDAKFKTSNNPIDAPAMELNDKPGNRAARACVTLMTGAFIAGLLILMLNIAGLPLTLRHPRVSDSALFMFPDDVMLTPDEFWDEVIRIEQAARESVHGGDGPLARSLTMAVNGVILHYWVEGDSPESIPLRAPVWENYWLWLASFVKPDRFRYYEFMDASKAVERGVGLCSQHAMILEQLLEERGVRSEMVGLEGHVVVAAHLRNDSVEGEEWLLDPDYGVVIPHALDVIERAPAIVRPYYQERGYSAEQIDTLAAIYGPGDNRRFESVRDWHPHKYDFERASYVAKWALPLILMAPWIIRQMRTRIRR